ncbi:MAG: hypothetical protein V4510_09045 [bacterium]
MKHATMQITALSILAAVLLAGCGAPPVPDVSRTANSLTSQAGNAVGNLTHAYILVGVSVTDQFDDSGAIYARSEYFSYYSPLDHYAKVVQVGDAGTTVRQALASTSMTVVALPVAPVLDPNNQGALNSTLSTLSSLHPSITNRTTVNYWLSTVDKDSVWTVTTNFLGNATNIRKFLDVDTGKTFGLNNTLPTPGVPAINLPGLNFTYSRDVADVQGQLWSSDAILVAVAAPEGNSLDNAGLFQEIKFDSFETTQQALVPPDLAPGDGTVPVWGFLYFSQSQGKLLPMYVYATVLAVRGDAVTPYFPAVHYLQLSIGHNIIDSTTAAKHVRPPLSGRFVESYSIDRNQYMKAWGLNYGPWDGPPEFVLVNGDNSGVECYPTTACA